MTIVINTKPDIGIILNILLQYPAMKLYIMECYKHEKLDELMDFLMGIENDPNY